MLFKVQRYIMKQNRILLFFTLFLQAVNSRAAIDNRYLPLFDTTTQHQTERRSVLSTSVFIARADEGYVDLKGNVQLPEIFGKYDMIKAANALVNIGKTNPLPTSWRAASSLIWNMSGKLHAQGVWLGYEQYLGKDLAIGFKAPFMHISSQVEFLQPDELKSDLGLGADGAANLYRVLNEVNRELGFNSYQWKRTDFGDLDLYLRWGTVQDYAFKCKQVDASFKIGALLPITGHVVLDSPTAISFGAYNHYGLYFETDLNCELKDDLRVGFWLNTTKRKAKSQIRRMSAGKELPQFGALVGEVFVDPGLTLGFSPYIRIDDLREGLGVRGGFKLCWHFKDYWRDQRTATGGVAAQLAEVMKTSAWESEYFTVGLVYDLQQNGSSERYAPYFYLDLDLPSRIFGSSLVSKTHRLSFGFEFNF